MRSATLPVPGATLYYEVRGTGPLLLSIPGGGGDAGVFDEMAAILEMDEKRTPPSDRPDLPRRIAELRARLAANTPAMLEHELRELTSYQPDYAVLAPAADRLVPAVGRDSGDTLPHRSAVEIAARLGRTVAEFPGGHNGIRADAEDFAPRLAEVLAPGAETYSV